MTCPFANHMQNGVGVQADFHGKLSLVAVKIWTPEKIAVIILKLEQ